MKPHRIKLKVHCLFIEYFFIWVFLSFANFEFSAAQEKLSFDKYHPPDKVVSLLKTWASEYPHLTKLIQIGQSAGGSKLLVVRIAAQSESGMKPDSRPAVLVSANIEGVHCLGTEAALLLIEKLLSRYGSDEIITSIMKNKTIYVAPLLNPDAAPSFFTNPQYERLTNNQPRDDDRDGLIDEDGPDDLNGDGLITQMRVKAKEGTWVLDTKDPRLMRKANPQTEGATLYQIYSEGADNDGDGNVNEDPRGGINLNESFPGTFDRHLLKTGKFPPSSPEVTALIKFLTDHPNIALVLNFSRENTLIGLPQTGASNFANDKIKIPENVAGALGLKSGPEYSLNEIISIIKDRGISPTGMQMNEHEVATLLGLNMDISIDREGQPWWTTIQKKYVERLRAADLNNLSTSAKAMGKGSFIAFCYLNYGVPVVSSNLWSPPQPATGDQTGSNILKWSDEFLQGKGFVNWTAFNHPTLGEVEIGGFVPYLTINPRPEQLEKTLRFHTDFYIDLIDHLAELKIKEIKVVALKNSLYKVTVAFTNPGWFPTSTARGRKTRTSRPITVRLKTSKEQMLYSGQPFVEIQFIEGQGAVEKLEWTIKGIKGSKIKLSASSPKLGSVTTKIELNPSSPRFF